MSRTQRSSICEYANKVAIILIITIAISAKIVLAQPHETGEKMDDKEVDGQEQIFSDTGVGDKNYLAIKYLKEKGLVDGYEDGTFKPDQEINRAEALKVLFKAINGIEKQNPAAFSFTDVKSDDWFYEFVVKAWNNYLIQGYPDGLFHPERTINRAESLKIILQQESKDIDIQATVTRPPYSDVPTDIWYASYAQIAKERTLFLENRSNGGLDPATAMTRGDFAELIYRVIKSKNGSRFARASWYADFLAKQSTASGEPYEPNRFTAAHKTLPFDTKLLITRLSNGKSVTVTVNDRGPYATGVDLDLSRSAFEALASTGTGITEVEFQQIDKDTIIPDLIPYGF